MTLNSPEPSLTSNNPNNSEASSPQSTIASIGEFLKQHTVYDLLPISYKVILLDHTMLVKQALGALLHNGVNCAPLWNSSLQQYAGLLTTNHFITLIHHFYGRYSYEKVVEELEQFQLHRFREVEQAQGIGPDPGISINPSQTVFEACQAIVKATNHTLPVLDIDPDTQQQLVVSVISQYRILKFLSVNYKNRTNLNLTLQQTKIGCYSNLATAKLSTLVIDIINIFMQKRIAAIPIVDDNGIVLNVFENNDILNLIRDGHFNNLELSVADALQSRSESFEGVHRCQSSDTLASILQIIKKETVNRLMVVDSEDRLEGIVTLSDILNYLIQ